MATVKRVSGTVLKAMATKIAEQVQRRAATGVKNAAVFLAARIKEAVSVPAPRKRVVSSIGDISYRATVKAIPGAPPRKLSGKLRQSVTYQMDPSLLSSTPLLKKNKPIAVVGVKARSVNGFNYPKRLETGGHAFMMPTVRKHRPDLVIIIGRQLKVRTVS